MIAILEYHIELHISFLFLNNLFFLICIFRMYATRRPPQYLLCNKKILFFSVN